LGGFVGYVPIIKIVFR